MNQLKITIVTGDEKHNPYINPLLDSYFKSNVTTPGQVFDLIIDFMKLHGYKPDYIVMGVSTKEDIMKSISDPKPNSLFKVRIIVDDYMPGGWVELYEF